MAGSNFLDGCKKYCGVGKWWSENYTYLFKAHALKILFILIYLKGIFFGEILKTERR